MTDNKDTLAKALRNAVKPNYDDDKGEWVLYCGELEHAQAILEAAKRTASKALGEDEIDKILMDANVMHYKRARQALVAAGVIEVKK
jgi:hypothetical protein